MYDAAAGFTALWECHPVAWILKKKGIGIFTWDL